VIGLLVSGVLVGKDMIRAAELRFITTQKDQLQTSVMLFQDKYQGLPGDLKNATAFWGEMGAINGGTSVCSNTAAGASGATGTQTCNGNGDGKISGGTVIISVNEEIHLFWQHLSNAGLVEGKYSGLYSGYYGVEGQEMAGKIKNTYWHPVYRGITLANTAINFLFEGDYGNTLDLLSAGASDKPITPTEAWGIDKKIDDEMPGLGSMVSSESGGVNCNNVAASASPIATTATYNLTYKSPACRIIFKNMW
jgi:hypothetical protein